MWEAATSRTRRAALWVRTRGVAEHLALRKIRTRCVPTHGAAEAVKVANRLAAGLVAAPRCVLRLTAQSCALIAASRLVALTSLGNKDLLHAELIPLDLAAIRKVGQIADGFAAGSIATARRRVGNVAARCTFLSARRKDVGTELLRKICA